MPASRQLVTALLATVLLAALGLAWSLSPVAAPRREPSGAGMAAALDRLPLAFTSGPATGDGFPSFQTAGAGYAASLSSGGDALVRLRTGEAVHDLRMTLTGATSRPVAEGRELLAGRTNHLVGDDPSRWRTDAARFGAVHYDDVYPGIDLVYHGRERNLEYDFVVAPGADPAMINVALEGAKGLTIEERGDLLVPLGSGQPGAELRMARPVVYQEIDGRRRPVDGRFVLLPTPGHVGFELGPYDRSAPLVIDPVLVSSSYLGGSGIDSSAGIAVDQSGNVYLTGYTESTDFQTVSPLQAGLKDGAGARTDAFVAKLNAAGTELLSATYFGGGDSDVGRSIAVGADGAVYVAGTTQSPDFPSTRPLQPSYGGGTSDAFVVKLRPDGSAVDYATMIGGSELDEGNGVAVDGSGNAFVTGATTSADFPTVVAVQATLGGQSDAFVSKVGADGSALVYSTYLGGAADEHGRAVALNRTGEAHVTGDTNSGNFPTVRPFQPRYGGLGDQSGRGPGVAGDAFLTKLDGSGSSLAYSTYLGGNDSDAGAGIALDRDGTAYVVGNTGSANFPLAKPLQADKAGDFDAFITAVNPSGAELVYSTFLGGGSADGAAAVALDSEGGAALVGATSSSDFPSVEPFQKTKGGGFVDGFVAALNQSGTRLELSSYVGGGDEDQATGVAVAADGTLHVTGYTNSGNFPVAEAFRAQKTGAVGDAFVTEVAQAGLGGDSASSARNTRLRLLIGTTIGLFLAAVLLTLWLRRHPRTSGPERPGQSGRRGPDFPGPERQQREEAPVRLPPPPRPQPPEPPRRPAPARPAGAEPANVQAPQARNAPPRPGMQVPTPRRDPRPDPRAPFTPPGGLPPEPPFAGPVGPPRPAPGRDRPAGPFTPPGGLLPPETPPPPPPARVEPPAPVEPPPTPPPAPVEPPPSPPAPVEPPPSPPAQVEPPAPPAPPPRSAEPEAAPPEVAVPDLLPPAEPPPADLPAPVDVNKPDLWETTEAESEPLPAAEPAPELGPDELAAWELLISSPIPSEYEDEPAATANGADDSAPPPPESEATPDLWAEDLPITPSSEPGSGDEWLRLLWSEDVPLPPEGDESEKPSSAESSTESEPGDRP